MDYRWKMLVQVAQAQSHVTQYSIADLLRLGEEGEVCVCVCVWGGGGGGGAMLLHVN